MLGARGISLGRSYHGSDSEKSNSRPLKCKVTGPMTKDLKRLLSLLQEATDNANRNIPTTATFITVVQSTGDVFRSTQLLLKELRQVLNIVKRHKETNRVVQVYNRFQFWYDTVRMVVSRSRSIETQSVELWLQSVYLNLTEQTESYGRLTKAACNISTWQKGKRLSNTLRDSYKQIKREVTQSDDHWKTNTEMLINVSKVAINLDSMLAASQETIQAIRQLAHPLETVKNLNRGFKKLYSFLEEHRVTAFPHQVYRLLASHVDRNWKLEMRNSSSVSESLADLTISQRLELDKLMHCLDKSILDMETATKQLPVSIYDSIRGNSADSIPTLDQIDQLAQSLSVIEEKAVPISNAVSFTDNLIIKMQQAKDH